jgi:hypothetical protein
LLEDADMELIRRSCAHVARWNIDAVMCDWAGYRIASKAMREKMTAAIEKERAVLSIVLGGG